jgi:hypothetical protein
MDTKSWIILGISIALFITIFLGVYLVPMGEQVKSGTNNTIAESVGNSIGNTLIEIGNSIRIALVTMAIIICSIVFGVIYFRGRRTNVF